jgi:glycosyltransferase involved in cell wall biosynthesis
MISIITINYDNSAGLAKTIESVINQSYKNIEYIVIDGGSNDNSKSIIEVNQSNINYWVSEKDKGIYNAMNKGIAKAKGDYLLFLNSGDYLVDKDVVAKMFEVPPKADIVYGNMQIDYGNGRIEHGTMPDTIDFYQMYCDTLWHPVSFIKKELFNQYGVYNENYKIVADYDFFFKVIIMHGVSTQHLAHDVAVYNLEGISSLAENKEKEQAERRAVVKSYLPVAVIEFAESRRNKKEEIPSLMSKIKSKLKGI